MKTKIPNLMITSAPSALLRPSMMSPAERAAGRFLRAPDGHEGAAPAPSPAPAPAPTPTPAPAEGGEGGEGAAKPGADDQVTKPEDKGEGGAEAGDKGNDADDGSIAGGAGAAGEEGKGDEGGDKAVELLGAPEGDYEVKAPEGMEFDQAAFDAVKDDFRELGLSNAGAQKLVDLYAGKVLPLLTQRAQEQGAQTQQADMAKLKKEWADAARADPTIGGANFEQTVDRIGRVWDKMGVKKGEGARAILDDSGLGNHPDILKLLSFTGAALEEAKFVLPTGGGADNRPIWDRVYSDPEPAPTK